MWMLTHSNNLLNNNSFGFDIITLMQHLFNLKNSWIWILWLDFDFKVWFDHLWIISYIHIIAQTVHQDQTGQYILWIPETNPLCQQAGSDGSHRFTHPQTTIEIASRLIIQLLTPQVRQITLHPCQHFREYRNRHHRRTKTQQHCTHQHRMWIIWES